MPCQVFASTVGWSVGLSELVVGVGGGSASELSKDHRRQKQWDVGIVVEDGSGTQQQRGYDHSSRVGWGCG